MTIEEAREALENAALALQSWGGERGEQLLGEFQAALTVYGLAERLAGHVGACQALEGRPANAGGDGKYHPCGSGWLCPDAPTGGQDDD